MLKYVYIKIMTSFNVFSVVYRAGDSKYHGQVDTEEVSSQYRRILRKGIIKYFASA